MLRSVLPASREARRILAGTLFSAIGRGLTLPFLLVYLTEVRGLAAATVGLLVGWMGAVGLVLAPLGGTLVDRFGARRVVLPLLVVASAGSVSLAFATSMVSAFVALTVIAVAFAALWSGQSVILASLVSPDERQKAFGLSFTILNLGIGLGGVIAGTFVAVADPRTFQYIYFGDAVSYLVPIGILLSMPAVGRRVAPASVPGESESESAAAPGGYREVLRNGPFVRFIVFTFVLAVCGYAQIEVGFTAFSVQVARVEPRVLGWAFAANTLYIVVAQLFVLRWLQGRSRARALALCACCFGGSWLVLALAGFAGGRGAAGAAVAGVIITSVVFAAGETLMQPVVPVITNALATDRLRGRYNALGSMMFGIASIAGPVAAGPLIGGGHSALWLALLLVGSLGAALLALSLRRHLTSEQDGGDAETVPRQALSDPVAAPAGL